MAEPTLNTPTPAATPAPTNGTPAPAATADKKFTLESLMADEPQDIAPTPELEVDPEPAADPVDDDPAPDDPPANDDPVDDPEPTPDPAKPVDPAKNGARDYTQFDEADRPFLKQMSRPAFEHFSKRLTALKGEVTARDAQIAEQSKVVEEAQGKRLPDSWYSDPDAFRASPAYKEAATEFQKAQQETMEWRNILVSLRSGKIRYDAAKDAFVPLAEGEQATPNAEVEAAVEDRRLAAFEKQKEHSAKANEIQRNFAASYQQAEQQVKAGIKQLFPWSADPKHAHQKHYEQIHGQWPEQYRKHPVTEFASRLAVTHLLVKAENAALKKQLEAAKSLKTDVRRAGPVPGRGTRPAPSTSDDKKYTKAEDVFDG